MSLSPSPLAPLRVTQYQARLVAPVLAHIVSQLEICESGNPAHLRMRPEILVGRLGFDHGEHRPEFAAVFLGLREKLQAVSGSTKRLHVNALELAAWAFCLRQVEKQVRHGHVKPTPRFSRSVNGWLARLENLRKRTKRRSESEVFRIRSQQWQRFLRWIRVYCLSCSCDRAPLPTTRLMRRRRKALVEFWIAYVVPKLKKDRVELPGAELLRDFIRRAMRSAKKKFGRAFLEAHCAKEPGEVHLHIYYFVLSLCFQAGLCRFFDSRELLAARGQYEGHP